MKDEQIYLVCYEELGDDTPVINYDDMEEVEYYDPDCNSEGIMQ